MPPKVPTPKAYSLPYEENLATPLGEAPEALRRFDLPRLPPEVTSRFADQDALQKSRDLNNAVIWSLDDDSDLDEAFEQLDQKIETVTEDMSLFDGHHVNWKPIDDHDEKEDKLLADALREEAALAEMAEEEANDQPATRKRQADAALLLLCQSFIPEWDERSEDLQREILESFTLMSRIQKDKEADFEAFLDEFRGPLLPFYLEVRLEGNQKLYDLEAETGLLRPSGLMYSTILGDFLLLRLKRTTGDFVEGFFAILFQAYRLNPKARMIFYAIRDGEGGNLIMMRHMLFVNPANIKECHDQLIYAFCPGDWLKKRILKKLRAPGATYRDALDSNLPAHMQKTYAGETNWAPGRDVRHRNRPVNNRIWAEMRRVHADRWLMAVVFRLTDPDYEDDIVPFISLHFVEHTLFLWFNLTNEQAGGLNINLFDKCVRIMKVSIAAVRRITKVINAVLEESPTYRLPAAYDSEAWYRTFKAIVPDQQIVRSSYLYSLILGRARANACANLKVPAIEAFRSASAVGTPDSKYYLTPMSESSLRARKRLTYGISENSKDMTNSSHPLKVLERWLQLVEQKTPVIVAEEEAKEQERERRKKEKDQEWKREKARMKEREKRDG